MPAGSTCSILLQDTTQRNCRRRSTSHSKMQKCTSLLLVCLILCATISQTFGLVLTGKEKRGWTLNSAGYLLGPRRIDHLFMVKEIPIDMGKEEPPGEYAVDNHRSFNDKHGFGGKRELLLEEDVKSGNFFRTLSDDNVLRTLVEFLTYLHLKESGALENLTSPTSSEETNQS
ncbi:galanin peptides isoform X1 [Hyla sarda]|uniref:galanin peptides isoform X1 n=1 Tax=Hyla sarda TaxID=327740 RepID=UPI0024C32F59|nr:galanin peptides isoform X1 [Hyla sarda]